MVAGDGADSRATLVARDCSLRSDRRSDVLKLDVAGEENRRSSFEGGIKAERDRRPRVVRGGGAEEMLKADMMAEVR